MIKTITMQSDFVPRVGDLLNMYDVFDDVNVEPGKGKFHFIISDVEWSAEGTNLCVTLTANLGNSDKRLGILTRHHWLPESGGGPNIDESEL